MQRWKARIKKLWPGVLTSVVFLVLAWLTSGTLSPYATSSHLLWVDPDCGYFFNGDYPHHLALFRWLEGAPREHWEFSVILRRVLYPVLSYPFYFLFGFARGGWAFNVLMGLLSIFAAHRYYFSKPEQQNSARLFLLLAATYMGWFYWTASPFSYGLILPFSFLLLILVEENTKTRELSRKILIWGTMSLLFLGYDLAAFFVPAVVGTILYRREKAWWKQLMIAPVVLLLPVYAVTKVQAAKVLKTAGDNVSIYSNILDAFFRMDGRAWAGAWTKFRDLPTELARIYLYSNFFWVPLVFLILALVVFFTQKVVRPRKAFIWRTSAESVLALVFLMIVIGNQLAPNYPGWQMRGAWISRLYQPAFVLLVIWISRFAEHPIRWVRQLVWTASVLAAMAQVALLSSPWWPKSGARDVVVAELNRSYIHFYGHSPLGFVQRHLDEYGARGVGMCLPQKSVPNAGYLLLDTSGGVHHDSSWRGSQGHAPVF